MAKKSVMPTLAIIILASLLANCSPGYKLDPQFRAVSPTHRTIALLPPAISIPEKRIPPGLTPEGVERIHGEKALALQSRLFSRFLERQQYKKYSVEFQDIELTNALLAKADLTDSARAADPHVLCETFGVDAVLLVDIRQTSRGSKKLAEVMGKLGLSSGTNRIYINSRIMDCATGRVLGEFKGEGEGDLMLSPIRLPEIKFNNIVDKFPYKRLK